MNIIPRIPRRDRRAERAPGRALELAVGRPRSRSGRGDQGARRAAPRALGAASAPSARASASASARRSCAALAPKSGSSAPPETRAGNGAASPYHVAVLGRKVDSEDPVADERRALVEQRAALEDLKRELAERVAAVAGARTSSARRSTAIAAGSPPRRSSSLLGDPDADRLAVRAAALGSASVSLAAREAALAALPCRTAPATRRWPARGRAARARVGALGGGRASSSHGRARSPPASASRPTQTLRASQQIESAARRASRRRGGLSPHAPRPRRALRRVTAREQLLAQRERELDEREDGWGGPELRELESRLRRLETQRTASDQTRSFSGGFRRLEQEGTRKPQAR